MRKITKLIFLLSFSFILFSCDETGSHKFEFYYYPQKNVYYDVVNSNYLYSLDGGATWDTLNVKSSADPATLGPKQVIYATTSDICSGNQQHRQQYKAQLISIAGYDSSAEQNNLAADRKIKKTKKPADNETKKTEKKPGFFQRLFGKKH